METSSVSKRLDVASASGRRVRAYCWPTSAGLRAFNCFCMESCTHSVVESSYLIGPRLTELLILSCRSQHAPLWKTFAAAVHLPLPCGTQRCARSFSLVCSVLLARAFGQSCLCPVIICLRTCEFYSTFAKVGGYQGFSIE